MKRVLCILLIAIISVITCNSLPANAESTEESAYSSKPATLIVNGEEIATSDAVIYYNEAGEAVYYDIPLIATLKALGAKVIWVSEEKALIFYGGFFLQLNTEKGTIYFLSSQNDYFNITGGGTPHPPTRKQNGKEYIVDERAADSLFVLLDVKMTCDFDNGTISIHSKSKLPGLAFLLNIMVVVILLPRMFFDVILWRS